VAQAEVEFHEDLIIKGERPEIDGHKALLEAPPQLLSLMSRCWAHEPGARPSGFPDIAREVEAFIENREYEVPESPYEISGPITEGKMEPVVGMEDAAHTRNPMATTKTSGGTLKQGADQPKTMKPFKVKKALKKAQQKQAAAASAGSLRSPHSAGSAGQMMRSVQEDEAVEGETGGGFDLGMGTAMLDAQTSQFAVHNPMTRNGRVSVRASVTESV
jgi:hypothetical protein